MSLLIHAVGNETGDIARLLIDAHAEIDTASTDALTALYLAVSNGYTEIDELLLERNANI